MFCDDIARCTLPQQDVLATSANVRCILGRRSLLSRLLRRVKFSSVYTRRHNVCNQRHHHPVVHASSGVYRSFNKRANPPWTQYPGHKPLRTKSPRAVSVHSAARDFFSYSILPGGLCTGNFVLEFCPGIVWVLLSVILQAMGCYKWSQGALITPRIWVGGPQKNLASFHQC